jgi:hypothetical protein
VAGSGTGVTDKATHCVNCAAPKLLSDTSTKVCLPLKSGPQVMPSMLSSASAVPSSCRKSDKSSNSVLVAAVKVAPVNEGMPETSVALRASTL